MNVLVYLQTVLSQFYQIELSLFMGVIAFFTRSTFLNLLLLNCLLCSSFGLGAFSQPCDANDLQVLKEFAGNLTNGPIASSWSNDSNCLQWDGVDWEVGGSSTNGSAAARISKLVLAKKGIQGSISPSLGRLDMLKLLDLSCNHLQGKLPTELSNLQKLKYLDLSFNFLSGSVSEVLSGMKSLKSLNISSNSFEGKLVNVAKLPAISIYNLSNNSFTGYLDTLCSSSNRVELLDLSMNHLEGNLEGLGNCSSFLQQLHIDFNFLSGDLPEFLFSIRGLEQLSISSNMFSGKLSNKLSKLSSLKVCVIYENRFTGLLPDAFENLTRLEVFVAHSNYFLGPLPRTLEHCRKLRVLDLRNNSLMGRIDLNFTNFLDLCTLDLASNNFSGSLPTTLAGHKLKILSVARNGLSGQVPENFANLSSLSSLSMSNNSLGNLSQALSVLQKCKNLTTLILSKNFNGEEIPDNVNGFESLMILALGNCALKGQIPYWLLNCTKLQVVDFSWNDLTGTIPSWIGKMENLFYLDFSNNSLAGELPRSLAKMKSLVSWYCDESDAATSSGIPLFVKRNESAGSLRYNHASNFPPAIYLSKNKINGEIWPEIGRLKRLHVLDLSMNNLTGIIPSSISEMISLEVLDLSSNDLHGPIPPSIMNLTFLSKFSVANNHLTGSIPKGGQFSSFPNSSFEGNSWLKEVPSTSVLSMSFQPQIPSGSKNKFVHSSFLGATISAGVGIAALLAIVLIRMSRRDAKDLISDVEIQTPRSTEGPGSPKLVLFRDSDCDGLTVGELLKSTNDFNQENIIGCGGFGLVYRATLPNGAKAAVKRLSGECGQVEREFRAEVEALSRARHENLVPLRGYCRHGNDRLLIYSYMENGSLDYWLHEGGADVGSVLEWDARLKIAQGAAHGLAYLHKACNPSIVHRDVKSSNILLDGRFGARLADFGLSRLLQPCHTHVTTDLVGTLGYIPPEYCQTMTASFKGDVYSFGVVLLELLTGRRPVEVCKGRSCRDLVSWVREMRSERREEMVIDPLIWCEDQEKQVLEVLGVACKCLDPDPRRRPAIDQVVSWFDGVGVIGGLQ